MDALILILKIIGYVVQLALLIVGIIVLTGKSYIKEKGKNYATKEDISVITGMIETVKNQMAYETQFKSKLFEDRKAVVIDAFEKLDSYHLCAIKRHFNLDLDYKEQAEISTNAREISFALQKAASKLSLYFGDKELLALFKSSSKILNQIMIDVNIANITKAEYVETINKHGDLEELKQAYMFDELGEAERAIRVTDKAQKEFTEAAQLSISKNEPLFHLEREKIRKIISEFITNGTI